MARTQSEVLREIRVGGGDDFGLFSGMSRF
jgi:hypothetical protein